VTGSSVGAASRVTRNCAAVCTGLAMNYCVFDSHEFPSSNVTLGRNISVARDQQRRGYVKHFFIPMARQPLGRLGRLVFRGFTVTHFRHTLGRTPLEEGPARRTDLYLTTHNTHKRQTSMPPVGFKPTILVSERPHTHALDRAATGTGFLSINNNKWPFKNFYHNV
jgi:hypothetical protein